MVSALVVHASIVALRAPRHESRLADPLDIGATGGADSELDSQLIGAAARATMLDTAVDTPVTVLQQPRPNVAIKEIESRQRMGTTDIAAAARFGCEFTHLVCLRERDLLYAQEGKKQ